MFHEGRNTKSQSLLNVTGLENGPFWQFEGTRRMTTKPSMRIPAALAAAWTALFVSFSMAAEPAPPSAASPPITPLTSDPALEKLLAPIREKHKVPGLVAGIIEDYG